MTAKTAAPAPGVDVDYHGSLTDWHGRYRLIGPCFDCSGLGDAARYELVRTIDGREHLLEHVRPGSFTVVSPSTHRIRSTR